MKQTAVEWLQEALEQTILTHEQEMQTIGLFEQAKAMEKEQIIDAYVKDRRGEFDKMLRLIYAAEQYYNKTYKR